MPLHDLPADCKPYASPLVLLPAMQPLKDRKNALEILRRYADTVVADRKDPFVLVPFSRNVNTRCPVFAKLDRIADKILEQLSKLGAVPHHFGQRVSFHHSPALFNNCLQIRQSAVKRSLTCCLLELLAPSPHSGISQEVRD